MGQPGELACEACPVSKLYGNPDDFGDSNFQTTDSLLGSKVHVSEAMILTV